MRADKRSAEARSPGSFRLVPTFQQSSAAYVPHKEEPWYALPAGAAAGFADAKPASPRHGERRRWLGMTAAKRSGADGSPGSFGLVPTCPQ
jgi:hypothetical protein